MPEDDFLIPRSSNSSMPDAGTSPGDEAAKNLRIDPKVLEERRRRKEALAPQPKTLNSEKDEPWRYMDRRISEAFPAFEELMWTLGDTARWVAERTRGAVDGLSIDDERLPDIVLEIQDALAAGEVRAWAYSPMILFPANCQERPGPSTSSQLSMTSSCRSFPFDPAGRRMMSASSWMCALAERMSYVDGLMLSRSQRRARALSQ